MCSHGPWPHTFLSSCAALTPGVVLDLTTTVNISLLDFMLSGPGRSVAVLPVSFY